MTSKIKQVGRGARIDKLTTQIHHFLEHFFPPENYPWEAIGPLSLEGELVGGVGDWAEGERQEGAGKQKENSVPGTPYLISFDIQF